MRARTRSSSATISSISSSRSTPSVPRCSKSAILRALHGVDALALRDDLVGPVGLIEADRGHPDPVADAKHLGGGMERLEPARAQVIDADVDRRAAVSLADGGPVRRATAGVGERRDDPAMQRRARRIA